MVSPEFRLKFAGISNAPDFVDRYAFIMLEYEKVLSDCPFGGILGT